MDLPTELTSRPMLWKPSCLIQGLSLWKDWQLLLLCLCDSELLCGWLEDALGRTQSRGQMEKAPWRRTQDLMNNSNQGPRHVSQLGSLLPLEPALHGTSYMSKEDIFNGPSHPPPRGTERCPCCACLNSYPTHTMRRNDMVC